MMHNSYDQDVCGLRRPWFDDFSAAAALLQPS